MTDRIAVRALRGATTIAAGEQPIADAARVATQELLQAMLHENALTVDDVVSALFTITPDLYGAAPARAAREAGWQDVAMLTASEAPSEHSLAHCIRVMLHVETTRPRAGLRHQYLRGATVLRPDLAPGTDDSAH